MARPLHSLLFLLALLLLPSCFRSKALWRASGERSTESSPLTLNTSFARLAHGKTADFEISGGSGEYACTLVQTETDIGSVTQVPTARGVTICRYSAPSSGRKLDLAIKIVDSKYPERQATATVNVPASGTPDDTFTDGLAGLPVGKIFYTSGTQTEVGPVLATSDGKYLVGINQYTSLSAMQIRRMKSNGIPDTTFGSGGTFQIDFNNAGAMCGTSGGSPPILRKLLPQRNGSGYYAAFEHGGVAFVLRILSDGTRDPDFGGRDTNYGVGGPGGVAGIAPNGCSKISSFGMSNSYNFDPSTMYLDANDNMYFASTDSSSVNIRKFEPNGYTFREMNFTPPNQDIQRQSPFNSGVFFETGGRKFLAYPVKSHSTGIASIAIVDFEESGTALQKGGYLGPQGLLVMTDVNMAGADAAKTSWWLKNVDVEPDGRIFLTGQVSYDDPLGADLNTFVYASISNLADVASAALPYDLYNLKLLSSADTSMLRQNTMNIVQRSPFYEFYNNPNSERRGFHKTLRQADGSYIFLGTGEQNTNLQLPMMARMTPGFSGALETVFGLAQGTSGLSFDQRWQLELTEFSGEQGAFLTGAILPDGKYLAGGFTQFSIHSGFRAGWLARYWP